MKAKELTQEQIERIAGRSNKSETIAAKYFCKDIKVNGRHCLLIAKAELEHLKGNAHPYFSITGDIVRINKWGNVCAFICGGCIHEIIHKHIKELRPFIPLHLCDETGAPMYDAGNAAFNYMEKGIKAAADYLRLTAEETAKLDAQSAYFLNKANPYSKREEMMKIFIETNNIRQRWQEEANNFINYLADDQITE